MNRYLLDTNTISDLVKHPQGRVAGKIASVGQERVFTSLVVAAELHYGVDKRGSEKLRARVELILAALLVVPLETPADRLYGQIRHQLETKGQAISANDLLIAAHALALDSILVTDNEGEFRRVDGLRVENWLR